jgi:tetratricopeptide (TPR) repeat protein
MLREALKEHPGAESEHAIGEFYLADKKFDEAITHLQNAVDADGSKAQLHSDLGAALLEKSKNLVAFAGDTTSSANRREILERSLTEFDEALRLKPSLLEALFNRALCYQEMGSYSEAKSDWLSYLEKDRGSAWSSEAQQHLDAIEKRD